MTAQHVDAEMRHYMRDHSIHQTWPVRERLLVCIGPSPSSIRLVRAAKRMAEGLGAEWIVAYVETPAQVQLGQIGVGKPARPRWKRIAMGSIMDTLVQGSGEIDVYVISGDPDDRAPAPPRTGRPPTDWRPYGFALGGVALCTALAWTVFPYLDSSNLIMVYLLGGVVVATRAGRGPSLMASVLGLVISSLAARIRSQARSAREGERRIAALSAMSRELAGTRGVHDLLGVAVRHIAEVFRTRVLVLLPEEGGRLAVRSVPDTRFPMGSSELAVSQWVYEHGRIAGHDTCTLPAPPASTCVCRAHVEPWGCSGSYRRRRGRSGRESGPDLDPATRRDLVEALHEEADRLNRLVQNLLEMTRLESGALRLHSEWHSVEEVVGAALGRFGNRLAERAVATRIPAGLPLVRMDDVLIEQVLINLVDNAGGTPLELGARKSEGAVLVQVADCGPGLPAGEEARIFEKFHRLEGAHVRGAGLGLAICKDIVQAHGGRIWAQKRAGGGVMMRFTLPVAETPPVVTDDASA